MTMNSTRVPKFWIYCLYMILNSTQISGTLIDTWSRIIFTRNCVDNYRYHSCYRRNVSYYLFIIINILLITIFFSTEPWCALVLSEGRLGEAHPRSFVSKWKISTWLTKMGKLATTETNMSSLICRCKFVIYIFRVWFRSKLKEKKKTSSSWYVVMTCV